MRTLGIEPVRTHRETIQNLTTQGLGVPVPDKERGRKKKKKLREM